MSNLWGFDKNDLKKEIVDAPSKILKEQIEIFDKMTDGILYGHLDKFRIKNPECEYSVGVNFDIIAPNMNGYRYQVFTMYTKPVEEYPVLFVKEADMEIDYIDEGDVDDVCENYEALEECVRKYLSHQDTKKIVQILYSKSKM